MTLSTSEIWLFDQSIGNGYVVQDVASEINKSGPSSISGLAINTWFNANL
jgi:hypothetical protein